MMSILTKNLFDNYGISEEIFKESEYPWQIIPKIRALAERLVKDIPEGYTLLHDGVIVGENVKIHESATLIGPAVIGANTEIRPGAYIRGSVIIGEGCVIGNSTELKNAILLDGAQVPHFNYVGDSILGSGAHLGAGAVTSNLKSDKSPVHIHASEDIETGLTKLGAILGDGVEVGCGCVLNPGTVIGKRTSVYPLTSLRGVYPEDSIVKSIDTVVKRI